MARLALVALLAVSCAPASELPGGQPSSASNPPGKASTRNPARAVPYPRAVLSRPARRADRDMQRAPLHDWTSVAECESSGDWHINTGNGYMGGLQMDAAFWANYGGLRFAPRPDLASELEQTVVAERGLAVQGIGAWPRCGVYLRSAA